MQAPVNHRIETYLKLTSSDIEGPEHTIQYGGPYPPREPPTATAEASVEAVPEARVQSGRSAGLLPVIRPARVVSGRPMASHRSVQSAVIAPAYDFHLQNRRDAAKAYNRGDRPGNVQFFVAQDGSLQRRAQSGRQNHFKAAYTPAAKQPGAGPYYPGSVAAHSVAVQCSPTPWMRFFFADDQQADTKNNFFKHYDVLLPAKENPTSPEAKLVEGAPEWVQKDWQRLYYINMADGATEWAEVSFPDTSADAAHSHLDVTHPDHVKQRMELEEFMVMVASLDARSTTDEKPLSMLRCGLLKHCAKLLADSSEIYKQRFLEREQYLQAVFDRNLQKLKEEMESELRETEFAGIVKGVIGKWEATTVSKRNEKQLAQGNAQQQLKIEELEESLVQVNDELAKAQSALRSSDARKQVLQSEVSKLKTEKKKNAFAISVRAQMLASTQDQLKSCQETVEQLKEQIAELKPMAALGTKSEEYYNLMMETRLEADRLRQGYTKRTKEHTSTLKSAIQSSESQMMSVRQAMSKQADQAARASQQALAAERAKLEQLNKQMDASTNELTQKWLAEKEKAIDLHAELNLAQHAMQKEKQQFSEAQRKNAMAMAAQQREMSAMLGEKGELAVALESVQALTGDKESEISQMMAEMMALQESMKISDAALEGRLDEVATLQKQKQMMALNSKMSLALSKSKKDMGDDAELAKSHEKLSNLLGKLSTVGGSLIQTAEQMEQDKLQHADLMKTKEQEMLTVSNQIDALGASLASTSEAAGIPEEAAAGPDTSGVMETFKQQKRTEMGTSAMRRVAQFMLKKDSYSNEENEQLQKAMRRLRAELKQARYDLKVQQELNRLNTEKIRALKESTKEDLRLACATAKEDQAVLEIECNSLKGLVSLAMTLIQNDDDGEEVVYAVSGFNREIIPTALPVTQEEQVEQGRLVKDTASHHAPLENHEVLDQAGASIQSKTESNADTTKKSDVGATTALTENAQVSKLDALRQPHVSKTTKVLAADAKTVMPVSNTSPLIPPSKKSVRRLPSIEKISGMVEKAKMELANMSVPPPKDAPSAEHEKYAAAMRMQGFILDVQKMRDFIETEDKASALVEASPLLEPDPLEEIEVAEESQVDTTKGQQAVARSAEGSVEAVAFGTASDTRDADASANDALTSLTSNAESKVQEVMEAAEGQPAVTRDIEGSVEVLPLSTASDTRDADACADNTLTSSTTDAESKIQEVVQAPEGEPAVARNIEGSVEALPPSTASDTRDADACADNAPVSLESHTKSEVQEVAETVPLLDLRPLSAEEHSNPKTVTSTSQVAGEVSNVAQPYIKYNLHQKDMRLLQLSPRSKVLRMLDELLSSPLPEFTASLLMMGMPPKGQAVILSVMDSSVAAKMLLSKLSDSNAQVAQEAHEVFLALNQKNAARIAKHLPSEVQDRLMSTMESSQAIQMASEITMAPTVATLEDMSEEDRNEVLFKMMAEDPDAGAMILSCLGYETRKSVARSLSAESHTTVLHTMCHGYLQPWEIASLLEVMPDADQRLVASYISSEVASKVLSRLSTPISVILLASFDKTVRVQILEGMPSSAMTNALLGMEDAAMLEILDTMSNEAVTRFFCNLRLESARELLASMSVKRGVEILSLMDNHASKLFSIFDTDTQYRFVVEMSANNRSQVLSGVAPPDAIQLLASLDEVQYKTTLACLDSASLGKIAIAAGQEGCSKLLSTLEPRQAADVLSSLEPTVAAAALDDMESEFLARLTPHVSSKGLAAVLESFKADPGVAHLSTSETVAAALACMEDDTREKLRKQLNVVDQFRSTTRTKAGKDGLMTAYHNVLELTMQTLAKSAQHSQSQLIPASAKSGFMLKLLSIDPAAKFHKPADIDAMIQTLFTTIMLDYDLQCMLTEVVYDITLDDDGEDDDTTYDDNVLKIVARTEHCLPASEVGDYLPIDPKGPQYTSCNTSETVKFSVKEDASQLGVVCPLVMDKTVPLLPCGPCFGTFTCMGAASALEAAHEDMLMVSTWLRGALTRSKHLQHAHVQNMIAAAESSEPDGAEEQDGVVALSPYEQLLERLNQKKDSLESLLDGSLSGLLVELKRYSKAPRIVVSIVSSLYVLLGNAKLFEMLKNGLGENDNYVKTIWDITRKLMNVGSTKKKVKRKDSILVRTISRKAQNDSQERNKAHELDLTMVEAMAAFEPSVLAHDFDPEVLAVVDNMWKELNPDQVRRCSKAAEVLFQWLSIVQQLFAVIEAENDKELGVTAEETVGHS